MQDNSFIRLIFEGMDNLEDVEKQFAGSAFDIDNYADGENFFYNNIEFIRLGEEQGGVLAIAARIWKKDVLNPSTPVKWRNSQLRKRLNESNLANFDKNDILPMTDVFDDYVSLLSYEQWKKYKHLLPEYNTWIWLRSPYYGYSSFFCYVSSGGSASYYYAYYSLGCAPIILFRKRI